MRTKKKYPNEKKLLFHKAEYDHYYQSFTPIGIGKSLSFFYTDRNEKPIFDAYYLCG